MDLFEISLSFLFISIGIFVLVAAYKSYKDYDETP